MMRGEVLHYDEAQGFGFIAGADGNRYTFTGEDLRVAGAVSKGTPVEFTESGSQSRGVFPASSRSAPRAASIPERTSSPSPPRRTT